jgi:hypothetical protein
MVPRVVAAVVLTATLVAAAHAQVTTWKHVTITRNLGSVATTLSYETSSNVTWPTLRDISVTVRGPATGAATRILGGTLPGDAGSASLTLRNVWGNAEPEVLVNVASCGNRCGDELYVAVERGRDWRIVEHDFGGFWSGPVAWTLEKHRGQFEFLTYDNRFFCFFASCAGTSEPPRVFKLDRGGHTFVDITRTRPDLARADAAAQWREYLSERRRGRHGYGYVLYGMLAPWCADEYLLGNASHCEQVLDRQLSLGYLGDNPGIGGRAFIERLRRQLVAWGYAKH